MVPKRGLFVGRMGQVKEYTLSDPASECYASLSIQIMRLFHTISFSAEVATVLEYGKPMEQSLERCYCLTCVLETRVQA